MADQPGDGDLVPPVRNETIGDVSGPVIQAGSIHSVTLAAAVPVRSYYREQVRRIAPARLHGREPELAELARFCTDPADSGRYRWWRAAAWSGKSALLSWFVLHPPPGVRVVSFFITARLPGQNDRVAFVDFLLEQLLALLGRPLPPFLTDTTREAHLLGLLAEAAEECQARGERLVLVVDGLDEDRGVVAGPGAHSIAALLPADPPADLRIIVAGRPNPPVPDDVPDDHPLRDPAIVRALAASPHARVRQYELKQDLYDLLAGSPAEQDLVGFLVASGGGIGAADLCELTGWPAHRMAARLDTVHGRVFDRRETRWGRVDGYLLGHEELHRAAEARLGDRTAGYRQRLHDWAADYRDRRWPDGTPNYLLDGYVTMLAAAEDLDRAVEYVTDTARHDRMLERFGTDAAALAEIERLADRLGADLAALGRVVVHRDHLLDRNSRIPAELLPVWASVGDFIRVENLAGVLSNADPLRSFSNPEEGARDATEVAIAAGERDHAIRLLTKAEELARGITQWGPETGTVSDPWSQSWAMVGVIGLMETLGQHDRAEAAAATLFTVESKVMVLTGRARSALAAGDPDRARLLTDEAETLARTFGFNSSPEHREQTRAWLSVAESMAALGDLDRAIEFVRDIPSRNRKDEAKAFLGLMETLSALNAHDRVLHLMPHAMTLIGGLGGPDDQARGLAGLAVAAGRVGRHDWAGRLIAVADARSTTDAINQVPADQVSALAAVGQAAVVIGENDRARRLVVDAEAMTWKIDREYDRALAMADVAELAMATGDDVGAELLAMQIFERGGRAWALARLARRAVDRGDRESARRLAGAAEAVARAMSGTGRRLTEPLYSLAPALVDLGAHETAYRVARMMPSPSGRARALGTVAAALAATGDRDRAHEVIAEAEQAIDAMAGPSDPAYAMADLANRMAMVGEYALAGELATTAEHLTDRRKDLLARLLAVMWAGIGGADQAELLARRYGGWDSGARVLIDAVSAAAASGHHDAARRLAAQAEAAIRATYSPSSQTGNLCLLAIGLVAAEPFSVLDADQAVRVGPATEDNRAFAIRVVDDAMAISEQRLPWWPAVALAALGEFDRARALASTFPDSHAGVRVRLLGELARLAVEAGETERAREMTADAAASIRGYMSSDGTMGDLVRALLVTGRQDEADEAATGIIDEIWRVRALADCVEHAVATGQLDRMERLLSAAQGGIDRLTDPRTRSEELTGLLRHIRNGADRSTGDRLPEVAVRTRPLLADALLSIDWHTSLPAMALAAPEAVTAIAHEILALPMDLPGRRSR